MTAHGASAAEPTSESMSDLKRFLSTRKRKDSRRASSHSPTKVCRSAHYHRSALHHSPMLSFARLSSVSDLRDPRHLPPSRPPPVSEYARNGEQAERGASERQHIFHQESCSISGNAEGVHEHETRFSDHGSALQLPP